MSENCLADTSRQRIWEVLSARQATLSAAGEPAVAYRRPFARWAAWTAVAAMLLLTIAAWLLRPAGEAAPARTIVQTGYDETRRIGLPDGTVALLNGNSRLSYVRADAREVWVEGEAFFTVKKAAAGARFIVHSPDLDIEVLGTQFNVNTRRGRTEVVLVEGKVQLVHPRSRAARVLELKPGEKAIATEGAAPQIATANPETTQAWTRQKFVFDNTPLADVAHELEDTYGLKVAFADASLEALPLTADLSNQDLETLLLVIEATFDLKVERTPDRITIRGR